MKSIPPEVYEQWGKFEDGEEDLYTVKKNPDFIEELQEIRQEIEKIPTTIKGIGYFNERDVLAYQIDVLKIIDTHISAITRKSISDRDCEHCKHRHPIGCNVWECNYEPRDEDKDEEDNE